MFATTKKLAAHLRPGDIVRYTEHGQAYVVRSVEHTDGCSEVLFFSFSEPLHFEPGHPVPVLRVA